MTYCLKLGKKCMRPVDGGENETFMAIFGISREGSYAQVKV